MRALLAAALVLLVSVSGCLGTWDKRPDYDQVEEDVEGAYLDVLEGIDDRTTFNTGLIAYHNGVDDSGDPTAIADGGYYTEIALRDDLVYLARGSAAGEGRGTFGGFSIIDIQDPERPTFVGAYDALTGSDIEVNRDSTLAFFGTQRNTVEEVAGRGGSSGSPTSTTPRGIHVVNITDKTAPELLAFYPLFPNGVHTLTYHVHANGNQYLIAATYDFKSNTVPSDDTPPLPINDPTDTAPDPNPATQRVIIYQIQDGGALNPVSEYSVQETPPEQKQFFPHDTFVEVHPLTGDTLMYVAYWDQGVHIVDINDPMQPVLLDSHLDFSPSSRGNIHFARPLDIMPDNRHITVTEPEIVSADETGYIWFIDSTDPEDISKAGTASYWTLPGDLFVTDLDYSPHNFDVLGGVVALAHNKAGVWFIDASDAANVLDPKSTGFYMPDVQRSGAPRDIPYTWGTRWLDDTTVLVSDEATGLHIIEYMPPEWP